MARRVDLAAPSTWASVVEEAATALRRGDVVLLPAEGLYGYHVRADDAAALAALQRVKPREAGRGWIVLLPAGRRGAAASTPDPWRSSFPPAAESLARAHCPGPLTLVVPAPLCALPELAARDGTIALRSPGSEFLQSVLTAAGSPLVSTSANLPGEPPPARFDECRLEGVALAVDGGALSGLPSTVVRVDGSTVEVLRSGALKVEGEAP